MLLPWSWAAAAAAVLLVAGLAMRRALPSRQKGDFAVETSVVLALYALWQEGGNLAVTHVAGAVDHGRWVWHVERALHLPGEAGLQRLALPHPVLVEALNGFYAIVHVPALIVFLLWMYFRHRDQYARWRNIGAVLTGACLALQMIPVAPPRLMPGLGFVDTALRYKESVYGPGGIGNATQLAAMPSVHVGWAVFVAVAVIAVSRSGWKWLVLLHPAVTVAAVVATANHWWLDGIVAAGLLPLSMLACAAASAVRATVTRPALAPVSAYAATTPRSSNASAI